MNLELESLTDVTKWDAPRSNLRRLIASQALVALFVFAPGLSAQLDGSGRQLLLDSGGVQQSATFGAAMASGDFGGSLAPDLVVCAPLFDAPAGGVDQGVCRVWLGQPEGFLPDVTPLGETGADYRNGVAVAAGNFDGVGRDEIVVASPGYAPSAGLEEAGAVRVWGVVSNAFAPVTGVLLAPGPGAGDEFGMALAVGDFNGDTYADLAIGVPGHDSGIPPVNFADAGAVMVAYGSAAGLQPVSPLDVFTREDFTVFSSQAGEKLGSALAAGDFDADGFDDLAIGSPLRDVNGVVEAGEVLLLEGGVAGLTVSATSFVLADLGPLLGNAGANFGAALAAGNFDSSTCLAQTPCPEDLAIGVPGYTAPFSGISEHGAVAVLHGSTSGLVLSGALFVEQADVGGVREANDHFGSSLLAAPLDAQAGDDLVVGVPFEIGPEGGLVHFIPGSPGLLQLSAAETYQFESTSESQNFRFGSSFAAADYDGNGSVDLAVGVPYWGVQPLGPFVAGAVQVLFSGSFFWDGFEEGDTAAWSQTVP